MMAVPHSPEHLASLLVVLALHGAALYGLMTAGLLTTPPEAETLLVQVVASPAPQASAEPKRTPQVPRSHPGKEHQARRLVAETPVYAVSDSIAPAPQGKPAPAIEAASVASPLAPLTLSSELAAVCADRSAPAYPAISRRLGETGKVTLRVELDEQGLVTIARIESSSGVERLDNAALTAVKTWRCTPAQRDGQPTRAVARQAFHFVLQGN